MPKSTPNTPNQEINGMNACRRSPGMNAIKAFPVWHSAKSTPNARVAFVGYESYRAFPAYRRKILHLAKTFEFTNETILNRIGIRM